MTAMTALLLWIAQLLLFALMILLGVRAVLAVRRGWMPSDRTMRFLVRHMLPPLLTALIVFISIFVWWLGGVR
ncbi:MAG: hypothetical protein WAX29_03440 [Propionibacterium sp.]|jgi:hypothetical protein|uniref:hypothetical protein n=1 Tax=Bifidobacterium tibiigranuli TaxID=2172043 RepID=UPI0023564210|nr:hypothetical protein [Bifidobacterium tibiigranuli]MCH3973537.1 hypothetical protein [Bifidobacterium tibiigranuli]